MSDNKVPVRALVDPQDKERAMKRLDHGGLSREIRQTVQRIAEQGKSRKKQLKEELDQAREKRDEKVAIRDKANTEIERINGKIERLEKQLDDIRDREGEYEGHLQSIETAMHDGMRVFPEHGQIINAAEAGDCEPADVIADLKERNPDLPESQFRKATQS
jgi:chromosome segregation ATPase